MQRISYGEWLGGRKDTDRLWEQYCKIYYGEWLPF